MIVSRSHRLIEGDSEDSIHCIVTFFLRLVDFFFEIRTRSNLRFPKLMANS